MVAVKDLKEGMRILSFLAFSDQYHSLNPTLCKWLGHNFQGTLAVVRRKGVEMELGVEQLAVGDDLQKLFRFPPNLRRLTEVTPKLGGELAKRGFLQFRVAEKMKSHTVKQKQHVEEVQKINQLIHKVQESVAAHDDSTEAVKELLTSSGEMPDTKTVENYVDQIIADSSQEALATMVSLKQSDQTYAHCVEVGVIFSLAYQGILQETGWKNPFVGEKEMMLAAFLHDLGKSKVPKEILDSTVRFERDSQEMKLMQSHPFMGAKILMDLEMPEIFVNMAHFHHVKLDPTMKSSYPQVDYEKVGTEARLLSVVDIYQALVGKRSYKKSWTPPDTMNYLKVLSGVEYPDDIYGLFYKVMGKYPKSSLVELSDGSVGFVTSVPRHDLDRPRLVLVDNANRERLTHNPMIDLALERELSIVKVHDSHDYFQGEALKVYQSLRAD